MAAATLSSAVRRIDRACDALDLNHGLLQQDQFRPQVHSELPRDVEQLEQHPRHRDFRGILPEDRLSDRAQSLREIIHRMIGRHIAGLEVNLGNALVIALQEAFQDLG